MRLRKEEVRSVRQARHRRAALVGHSLGLQRSTVRACMATSRCLRGLTGSPGGVRLTDRHARHVACTSVTRAACALGDFPECQLQGGNAGHGACFDQISN